MSCIMVVCENSNQVGLEALDRRTSGLLPQVYIRIKAVLDIYSLWSFCMGVFVHVFS